jgi:peroxiredoxin
MKKFALIIIALSLISCRNSEHYIIKGHVQNKNSGVVRLFKFGDTYSSAQRDTLKNGKFLFEGKIDFPENFWLTYEESKTNKSNEIFSIFIEPSAKVNVIIYPDSIPYSYIKGSKISETFWKVDQYRIREFLSKFKKLTADLTKAINAGDQDLQTNIQNKGDSINEKAQRWQQDYIRNNPNSYISAYYVYTTHIFSNKDTLRKYFKLLDNSVSESVYAKTVKSFLSVLPGNQFEDFELYDAHKKLNKMSDIAKDKVILLDFWYTACKPCREQNLKLVKIYDSYKTKGFEIVSISTDRDTADFIRTIHDDNMSWTNLIDRSDQTAVQNIYEISHFTTNVLIDRKGIIAAKDVPLDRLEFVIDSLVKL